MKKKLIPSVLFMFMYLLFLTNMTLTAQAASGKPGTVKLVSVCATDYNKVRVIWDQTSNATNYIIYYKAKGASKWIKKETVASSVRDCILKFEVGKEITVGKEYVCTVRAYNKNSKKYGNYNKKGKSFKTTPEKVYLNNISMNSSGTGITIGWICLDTEKGIEGGDCYLIYRKTTGKWKKIAKVKSDTLSYTDKKFVKGKVNTYRVIPYNSKTKTKGEYEKQGISMDLTQKKPVVIYKNSEVLTLLKGTTEIINYRNKTDSVKWSSSNPKVVKVLSSGKDTGRLKALRNGKATVTVRDGDFRHVFTITVASGDDYVKKWIKYEADAVNKLKVDTEGKLLAVSMNLISSFTYGEVYDMKSVISQKKGTCYSVGELMARIYRAMGYKAKVRSAVKDNMSRYPDNLIMASNHYNVEVIADGRKYYLDATPELTVAYLSSSKEPLAAYFNFAVLGGGWQRIL